MDEPTHAASATATPDVPAPDPGVFSGRRDEFVRRMRDQGVDLAVVTTPESIMYLTGIDLGGYWSPQYLILNADGEHAYVIRGIEIHWQQVWAPTTWCINWVPYHDDQEPAQVAGARMRSLSRTTPSLACETNRPSLPFDTLHMWTADLTPTTVSSASALVEGMRVIKSQSEIETIRAAGRMTAIGMHAAVDAVANGETDTHAAAAAFVAMFDAGSEFLADNPFVAVGPESAAAHARSTNRRPLPGEVVPIMMSAAVHRYQCPVERTYAYRETPPELHQMLTVVADTVEAVIEGIRPGMESQQVDAIARDRYAAAGLSAHFLNRLGYSFGLAYPPVWWENEIMQLRPGDTRLVEAGMVFHLVPALHVPGLGFLNRSMPIVVTNDGCEPLIDYPIRIEPIG